MEALWVATACILPIGIDRAKPSLWNKGMFSTATLRPFWGVLWNLTHWHADRVCQCGRRCIPDVRRADHMRMALKQKRWVGVVWLLGLVMLRCQPAFVCPDPQ